MSEMTPKEMAEKCKIIYKQVDELLSELQDEQTHTPARLLKRWMTQVLKLKKQSRYRNYSRP